MKLLPTIAIALVGFFLGWNAVSFALDLLVINGVVALMCAAAALIVLKEDIA